MFALIALVLRLLLFLFLLGLVLAVLATVFQAARAVVRALAQIAVIVGGPVLVGVVVAGLAARDPDLDAGLTGLLAAAVSLPVAIWAARGMFAPGGEDVRSPVPDRSATVATPSAPPPEPAGDHGVATAWTAAFRLLPAAADELTERRAAAAAILHLADAGSLDPVVIETAVALRKHLPTLVTQAIALAADQPPARSRGVADELLAALRDLTDAALAHRAEADRQQHDGWTALRAHLRRRAGRD